MGDSRGFSHSGLSRPSEQLLEVRSELQSGEWIEGYPGVQLEARFQSMRVLAVNAEQQVVLKRAIGMYLGPLAKTIARRGYASQLVSVTLM